MRFKKLAILTDCVHVFDANGNASTENHIFRKQMEALAGQFTETLICCPFEANTSDKVTSRYTKANIRFHPLPQVGGSSFADKIQLLKAFPAWFKAYKKAAAFADIVYQRFPNNLNIPGFFYFFFRRAKVFATYTGTWQNYASEPITYRLQKWLLKHWFRGPVGAYIKAGEETGKIFKTGSPSYSTAEWAEETAQVEERIRRIESGADLKPVFITVGALVPNKNQQYILEAFRQLHKEGFCFQLHIVGDGPLKKNYAAFNAVHGLDQFVRLEGKKTDGELRALYRQSDFLIQAPRVEGFGKVPVEGFFHGVVPLLSNVALAAEMTGEGKRGYVFEIGDVAALAELIKYVLQQKNKLPSVIRNGRAYAQFHTLENWAALYHEKIGLYFE